jgi:hypothetical protein
VTEEREDEKFLFQWTTIDTWDRDLVQRDHSELWTLAHFDKFVDIRSQQGFEFINVRYAPAWVEWENPYTPAPWKKLSDENT